jgi:NitT/TauT family transport system substrate-binding protein
MRWYRCLTQKQQLAVCLTAVLLSLAACEASEPEQTAPADEVTFLTGAGYIAAQGYGFVADAKGFFTEENLKVEVRPGNAGESNMQLLRAGEAQFAAIEYSGAIQRAAAGQFDGVHCIAVLNEKTTNALMALASSGIRTARDLPDKTVAVIPGSAPKILWPAYAGLVTPKMSDQEIRSVRFVDAPANQLATFLAAGKVDAIGQFAPGLPTVTAVAKGAPISVIPYGDYMTDMYGAVLVARDDVDADVKRRFTKALLKGLQYTVDHPDEAAQIISTASNGVTKAEIAAKELRLLKPYVGSPQATPELVARSIALMQGIGAIPEAIPADKVFDFSVVPSATPVAAGGDR